MTTQNHSIKIAIITMMCGLFLTGCGGGGGGGGNTTGSNTQTINGIAVPPEPDSAQNNSTLAGIDTNNNGVRDDVERKIAASVTNQTQYNAKMTIAKTYQQILTSPSITGEEINELSRKNIACVILTSGIEEPDDIKKFIFNNSTRKADIRSKLSKAGGYAIGDCK